MNNWGMDGNNTIINKRERLILILPFLTGFGAATALRPVFCFSRMIYGLNLSWLLRKRTSEDIIDMI